ncbi:MAG TPA: hypothetical protein VK213_03230 [Bacteroidales bacterium]|nr:hypothetical protein [Bacteroidales bacterium]
MFPGSFIKRLEGQEYIDQDDLLASLKEPSPVSIMINRSKWTRFPEGAEPVPWCESGFYLQARPSFTLDPLFHAGCYYPREASGMFIEEALRQSVEDNNNLRVLDLCGAPGGKSIHLSGLINGNSLLISNEVIRTRASILDETITKWGCTNTLVTNNDPAAFGRLKGYFDVIVADVPCSGEGMFRGRVAVDQWSEENAFHCSERQKRIISDVWPALRENGILIYSTCTFNPDENEKNISWLIDNYEAEIVPLDVSSFTGITGVDYNGIKGYGFYPGKIRGEGFFLSVIRKTSAEVNGINSTGAKYKELIPEKRDISLAGTWIEISDERIIRKNDALTALPCAISEYLAITRYLNIIRHGIHIASIKGKDYIPVSELVLAQSFKSTAFPSMDADYETALKFLHRDSISAGSIPVGWNTVTYMKQNLGLIKCIGQRVNNYYPVSWRIRMDLTALKDKTIISWNDRQQ